MADLLRRWIVRTIAIVGAPFVFWLEWLTGPEDWRRAFREDFRMMWRADRRH